MYSLLTGQNESIPNGHVVEYTFYSDDFTDVDWQQDKVMMTRQLLYCEEDEAPEFRTPSIPPHLHVLTNRGLSALQTGGRCEDFAL